MLQCALSVADAVQVGCTIWQAKGPTTHCSTCTPPLPNAHRTLAVRQRVANKQEPGRDVQHCDKVLIISNRLLPANAHAETITVIYL
jgi:hypothetical protein